MFYSLSYKDMTLMCQVGFGVCTVEHIIEKSSGSPIFLCKFTPEEFVTMMNFLRECFSNCKIKFSEYLYETEIRNVSTC
jgi:hypothetical protein